MSLICHQLRLDSPRLLISNLYEPENVKKAKTRDRCPGKGDLCNGTKAQVFRLPEDPRSISTTVSDDDLSAYYSELPPNHLLHLSLAL